MLNIFSSTGVKCVTLTQPASLTVRPGQTLTRQPAGKTLEWIGHKHGSGSEYYKDSLKNKFSISLDSSSNTVTLTGQNVQPEDTAVYYCARRHSDTNHWYPCLQQTLPIRPQ
uniref:Immunoglobulin V-set domain-containing protein n=1 Tax=Myripristis murdjan TaxID=586833 RepID=A0A667XGU7_9TELE